MGVLEDVKAQYPSLAFLLKDPEVGKLLREAVDPNKGFDDLTFQSKLYETKWFKSRSAKQRQNEILRHTDPAEWREQYRRYYGEVAAQSRKLGARLTASELKYMASASMNQGIDPGSAEFNQRLADHLMRRVKKNPWWSTGTLKGAEMQVQNAARSKYYTALSSREARNWAIQLSLGTMDQSALDRRLAEVAMSKYPHLMSQLGNGKTMEDIFSGHRQIVAEELEIAPDTIDMVNNATYRKMLGVIDPADKKMRPMSLHEAQTLARQDKRWWKTSKGKEMDAGMTNKLLNMFGMRSQ